MIGTIVNVHERDSRDKKAGSGKDPSTARLNIRLLGRGPVKETLSQAVSAIRGAVKRVGQVLVSGRPDVEGVPRPRVETECELFIVSWDESQAVAVLELPPPDAQLTLFGDIGEESLSRFLDGLARIADRGLDPTRMPPGFDQEVLRFCLKISDLLNAGFDSIDLCALNRTASLDRRCRDNLCQFLIRPPRLERWTITGRLEALSGRGRLTGMVWDESGNRWICRFKSEHLPHLPVAWMNFVELTGKATLETDRDRILEVESIAVPSVIAEEMSATGLSASRPTSDSWENHDLEDIFSPEESPNEILKNILWD